MMVDELPYKRLFLLLLLAFGLLLAGFGLGNTPPVRGESSSISAGELALRGDFGLFSNADVHSADNPAKGFALAQPVLAALGYKAGGMTGARVVSIFFGIALAATVFFTGSRIFSPKTGLLAAVLLLSSGVAPFVSTMATNEAAGAFFLALSLFFILEAERPAKSGAARPGFFLPAGAASLFAASVTCYTVFIFAPAYVLYALRAFHRKYPLKTSRCRNPVLCFLLPYAILCAIFAASGAMPEMAIATPGVKLPIQFLSDMLFGIIGIPVLLAFFGLFHEENGKALAFILLAAPVIVFHIFSGNVHLMARDAIFALVPMSLAMALGVEKMADLFSTNIKAAGIGAFFTASALIIVCVYGIQEFRALRNEHGNWPEIAGFLDSRGFDGMIVLLDSRYGGNDYIFGALAGGKYPRARFVSVRQANGSENRPIFEKERPDFVIYDEYYGGKNGELKYIQDNFTMAAVYRAMDSTDVKDVKIFARRK